MNEFEYRSPLPSMSALLENIETATKRFEGKGSRGTFTKARHYHNLATRTR